jgi:hypothetical protein
MNPHREDSKLGSMTNNNPENEKENKRVLSRGFFEIYAKGHLDETWSDWLEGLEVKLLDNGEMILSGQIRDQAALMGILNKLYRLNLTLLSFSEITQNK